MTAFAILLLFYFVGWFSAEAENALKTRDWVLIVVPAALAVAAIVAAVGLGAR